MAWMCLLMNHPVAVTGRLFDSVWLPRRTNPTIRIKSEINNIRRSQFFLEFGCQKFSAFHHHQLLILAFEISVWVLNQRQDGINPIRPLHDSLTKRRRNRQGAGMDIFPSIIPQRPALALMHQTIRHKFLKRITRNGITGQEARQEWHTEKRMHPRIQHRRPTRPGAHRQLPSSQTTH